MGGAVVSHWGRGCGESLGEGLCYVCVLLFSKHCDYVGCLLPPSPPPSSPRPLTTVLSSLRTCVRSMLSPSLTATSRQMSPSLAPSSLTEASRSQGA